MIPYEKFCETANMTPPKEVYETAAKNGEFENVDFLQEEYLQRIQKEYRLFHRYFEPILAAAAEIRNDEFLRTYANLHRVAAFNPTNRVGLIKQTPDNPALCYAPLFALLAHIDKAEEEMCRRGVEQDVRLAVHSVHEKRIANHEAKRGFPAFNDSDWFHHFLIPDIYPIGNLEFEITTLWCSDSVFRSAKGDIVALRDVQETAETFCGKRLLRGGAETEDVVLNKAEYCRFLEPGDDVISVHIPKGTPLNDEICVDSYKRACQFFKKHYPDRPAKAMLCRSWLMDPALAEILNENSKIVGFQSRYRRFAAQSNGREVFVFVFDGYPEDLNTLPEDTSLLRAMKKRYLQNDPIYAYFGILDLE